MTRYCCLLAVLFVAVGLAVSVPSAKAAEEFVVIRSTHAALAPGMTLKAGETVALPADTEATLVSADGKTITLKGPHQTKLVATPDRNQASLIATLRDLARENANIQTLGAVRGESPIAVQLRTVDGTRQGTQCLAGANLQVRRSSAAGAASGSIRDGVNGQEVAINWEPGRIMADWPMAMPPVDGRDYVIRAGDRAVPAPVRLRLAPATAANDVERIAWFAQNDCRREAVRLMQALR